MQRTRRSGKGMFTEGQVARWKGGSEGRRRGEAGEEDDRGCTSSTSNLSREKSQPLRLAAGKQLLANTGIAVRYNEGSRM